MKTLLFQIEKAWDEDILPEFIADYIASGCGTLNDIRTAIKSSHYVSETDVDNAVKYLEMKDMLPNKVDPYKQFVDAYNAGYMYDDFELKNMLAAIYFPHMGNAVWDNAYSRILKNFESLKDQRSDRFKKYDVEKKEEVKQIMNEALDLDIMTVQDMLSAEIDNVSDEGLDADIRLYKYIASKLGVKNYDNLFVGVDDGNYNPEWILEDGLMLPNKEHKLYMYPSANMVAEFHPTGNIFMYFSTEEDANKYFDLAKKFLDDFNVDENQFYDDKHAEEWMDRNPHGYYNDESDYGTDVNESVKSSKKRWSVRSEEPELEECSLSNLEETLNRRDIKSNNKYDLLNLYLREHFSLDSRKTLVDRINNGASDKELCEMLTITESDDMEPVNADTKELLSVDELVELTKTNGSVIIENDELLNKAVDYLVSNGIDYDTDSYDDQYRLTWYVGVDDNSESANVKLATELKTSLQEVMNMLDDIISSDDAARSAMYNNDYIKQTLIDVLASCDKFEY